MKPNKIIIALLVILVIIVLLVLKYSSDETIVAVDCDDQSFDQSLAEIVKGAEKGTRIVVSGDCQDSQTITITQDNIVIDGRGKNGEKAVFDGGGADRPILTVQSGRKNIVLAGLVLRNSGNQGLLIEKGGVALVGVDVVDSRIGIQIGELIPTAEMDKLRAPILEKIKQEKSKQNVKQQSSSKCVDCEYETPDSDNSWGLGNFGLLSDAIAQTSSCPALPANYICEPDIGNIESVPAGETLVICATTVQNSLIGITVGQSASLEIVDAKVDIATSNATESNGVFTRSGINIRNSSSLNITGHSVGIEVSSILGGSGIVRACDKATIKVVGGTFADLLMDKEQPSQLLCDSEQTLGVSTVWLVNRFADPPIGGCKW